MKLLSMKARLSHYQLIKIIVFPCSGCVVEFHAAAILGANALGQGLFPCEISWGV